MPTVCLGRRLIWAAFGRLLPSAFVLGISPQSQSGLWIWRILANPGANNNSYSSPKGSYYTVVLLTIVYSFNFIDRQLLAILQESIKVDLALSDSQLGLLTGFAFAVFYVTAGISIARSHVLVCLSFLPGREDTTRRPAGCTQLRRQFENTSLFSSKTCWTDLPAESL